MSQMDEIMQAEQNGITSQSLHHQQNAGNIDTACTFTESPRTGGYVTVHVWQGGVCISSSGYPANSQDADGLWIG